MNDIKTYFLSDLHFYHKNILKFCPTTRKGKDCVEMTELMIAEWNAKVRPHDIAYLIGDISFGNFDETFNAVLRLNGQKHLVYGNHDQVIRNNKQIRDLFVSVSDYKEIKIDDIKVCLFHFPIAEWHQIHRGSFHLHGHQHTAYNMGKYQGRVMDVGVDSRPGRDMSPWSWEEIKQILIKKPILEHHNRKE